MKGWHVVLSCANDLFRGCWSGVQRLLKMLAMCVRSAAAPFAGKSTLAQQLASRLNLANVVQTDIIYEVDTAIGSCLTNWLLASCGTFHCQGELLSPMQGAQRNILDSS